MDNIKDKECHGQADATVSGENNNSSENTAEMSADAAAQENEWRDKYLRLSAEFDNYRKRTLKEKMDLVSYGCEDVLKSLLPVLDDMDRALAAMLNTEDIEAVRSGVELIAHKLGETLRSKGLSEIESIGSPLDTDNHEAVAKVAGDKKDKGRIIDVVQKGYKLKDKVIRHAKVVVGE